MTLPPYTGSVRRYRIRLRRVPSPPPKVRNKAKGGTHMAVTNMAPIPIPGSSCPFIGSADAKENQMIRPNAIVPTKMLHPK